MAWEYSRAMSDIKDQREPLGEVKYPAEVREALKAVTELPDDLDKQAEFFDKIQDSLATRLREEQ
jgi:hypothetical protein